MLLTENQELGFIGAAYLAARQHGVYCWLPLTQELEDPKPDGAGLLPILASSPLDKNDSIDVFGELLTVGNTYESDVFQAPNPNNWVRQYAVHPLLVTPDCCWTGMVTSIAPEVTRRGLTIVVLDKSLRADNEENFRSIVQELQFTCGAQVVELNKPAADSTYNQCILQTALRENHVRVEGSSYGTMLCTLDEFRRVHGGLCNANICCYARMLCRVQRKLGVRALTEAQALEPITLTSRVNTLLAARTVANSPLVKTAVAGHDCNWGRIAAALGRSGASFRQEDVDIDIMGMPVMRSGLPCGFDEDEALRRFEEPEISIDVALGAGEHSTRMWTCDFTHDYITINGDYRT